jgi:putative oxidoreductase
MKTLTENKTDIAALLMRLSLGGVIFAHGAQKAFGWFGGYGFAGTMGYFTGTIGLPYVLGVLVILGESIGAIALMLGLFGRFMSVSMFLIMMGALCFDHAQNGFYMNWYGNRAGGEGIEFDLLAFGLSLALLLIGSGKYSIDQYLWGKKVGA